MNNPRKIITSVEIYGLLLALHEIVDKNNNSTNETFVSFEEINLWNILLNSIDQDKISTTKEEARDFYFKLLNLIERLVKFNKYKDLSSVFDQLDNCFSSGVDFISVVHMFNNSESSRMFFLARLEEITEEINTQEYSELLESQRDPVLRGFGRVNWI